MVIPRWEVSTKSKLVVSNERCIRGGGGIAFPVGKCRRHEEHFQSVQSSIAPWVIVERARNRVACVSVACVFQSSEPKRMFWHLPPAPVNRGQQYKLLPFSAEECIDREFSFDEKRVLALPHGIVMNAEEKSTREQTLTKLWTSFVKDELDVANF